MIAKLEMTLNTAQQNKSQIQKTKTKKKTKKNNNRSNNKTMNQQQHTLPLRTLSRSYWEPKLILLAKSSP